MHYCQPLSTARESYIVDILTGLIQLEKYTTWRLWVLRIHFHDPGVVLDEDFDLSIVPVHRLRWLPAHGHEDQ